MVVNRLNCRAMTNAKLHTCMHLNSIVNKTEIGKLGIVKVLCQLNISIVAANRL